MLGGEAGKAYSTTYEKYNVTAPSYDDLYREEQFCKYRCVEKLIGPPSGTVADVGCGTGLLYEYLAETGHIDHVARYLCVEPSTGMIRVALGKSRLRSPSVSLVLSPGEYLALAEEAVDEIYMFTVWSNLEKPVRVLESILAARPRLIVITVLARDTASPRPPSDWLAGRCCGDDVYVWRR